ncbi:MAG: AmmeMemoRadiSam system protein A [Gammaproteobacteria bacterium]
MSPTDIESIAPLTKHNRELLLKTARESIRHGLKTGKPLPVIPSEFPLALQEKRATFVTLEKDGQLRGCIGMLEAQRPLIKDIAENAFSAAFRDPRFPPVGQDELEKLDIHLSILSPAQPLSFNSEKDLLGQLRPGIDGLILQEGARRGTFLPSVWKSLKTPEQFLRHLKQKAGFEQDYWSETVKVSRYTAEYIE